MKVLIEIDEGLYQEILDNAMFAPKIIPDVKWAITSAMVNGIPLNGTNGEVFGKIMGYMFMDDAYITTDRRGYIHLRGVKDSWWNADYKG